MSENQRLERIEKKVDLILERMGSFVTWKAAVGGAGTLILIFISILATMS